MGYEARISLFHGDRLDYRFCSPRFRAARRPVPVGDLIEQARSIDAKRCQRLVLADAPLEHPHFNEFVRALGELGLSHIAIETDGAPLAAEGAIEALVAAGVEKLFVVCGGIRKRVYEAVMSDATFVSAMKGIALAAESAIDLYVVVPLIEWTARDIEPLLEWLIDVPGTLKGFLLAPPEVAQVPPAARKLLLPVAEQAAIAARVFTACGRNRVEYGFATKRGLLPCGAKGALDRFGTVFFDRFNFLKHAPEHDEFRRIRACADCSLAQSCPGVEEAYLRHFGEDDLSSVPLAVSMDWKLKRINKLEDRDYKNVSPFENDVPDHGRSLLRINGHCNMSCSFCFIDRTVPDFDADGLMAEIDGMAAHNLDHLVLSGGEPTLHPRLADLIRHGKALGYRTVEIQSNGVKAAEPEYARELAAAGLNKITVSLHSIEPEHSDKITRLPQAFGKTIAAMHNFRNMGVMTQVAHVITKSNFAELPDTVRFLRTEFPENEGHLSICFGVVQPISDLVYTWVMPTFTEIKPFMRDALDYCLETGVGFGGMIGQGGYPPCMLDGEMRYYERNLANIYKSEDHSEQFYKAERCKECSFDAWCLGVRKIYVETYGEDEIKPFSAPIQDMLPPEMRSGPKPVPSPMRAAPSGLLQIRRKEATA